LRKKEQDGFCEEKPPRNEKLMLSDESRSGAESRLGFGLNETHNVSDGEKFFCVFIRHFDAEFFFESHHKFDSVERVGTEVFDEFSVDGDKVSANAELFHNGIFYTFFGTLF